MQPHLLLAQTAEGAGVYYQLARIQSLTEWWHWLVLAALCLLITGYVVFLYVKDSFELPRGLAVALVLLRVLGLAGILFFFFGLEKPAERSLVKNSPAV